MIIARSLAALAAAALLVAIAWAAGEVSISDSFARIIADPWGVVTLVDLYAGFVLIAIIIAYVEPLRWVAVLAVIATPVLGSLVPAAWLLVRLPYFVGTWRAPPE